jgi:hypothetical protein
MHLEQFSYWNGPTVLPTDLSSLIPHASVPEIYTLYFKRVEERYYTLQFSTFDIDG